MRKVILHIGLHKTATTFLQTSVWNQPADYTLITRPYTQHNHAFNQLQYADDSLYNESFIRHEIDKFGDGNIILSDESFSGKPIFFSYINRSIVAKRFASLFPDAEVIIFLRDQKDIVRSHYSSYIRMPFGTKSIEQVFRKPGQDLSFESYKNDPDHWDARSLYYNTNDFHIHLDCFRYAPLVRLYKDIFRNCRFFLYEDVANDADALFLNLSELLETNLHGSQLPRKNTQLTAKKIALQRRENRITPAFKSRVMKKLARTANQIVPVKSDTQITERVDSHVGDYYSKDNSELKQLLPHLNWGAYPHKYR